MPRTSHRKRIAEGVYRDNLGLAASVKVGTRQREKRFPLGTDLQTIKAWREAEKVRLRGSQTLAVRGSFAAEGLRYLKIVKGSLDRFTYKSRRSEVRAWSAALGTEDPRKLVSARIRETIGDWRAADISPKTIRNRVGTLGHLWRTLYSEDPPLDGIDLPKTQKRRPAFVGADIIKDVEAQLRAFEQSGRLRDSRQRGRFMVIATCGMRPAQLKRMQPADVDLTRRVALIPGAKDGEPVGLWLNDDMLAAWQTFTEADAWGPFDTRGFGRILRHAGWPAGVRPYNARHAVGIELGERGVDFQVIADFLGHSSAKTTRDFYVPALSGPLKRASESIDKRFNWLAPDAGTVKRRKNDGAKSARPVRS